MQKFFVIAVAICLTWSRIDAACTGDGECGGQGSCDLTVTNGACVCNSGYTGDNCGITCPDNCAAGECTFTGAAGSCGGICMTNFQGDACDTCVAGKTGTACDLDCPANCAAATDCTFSGTTPSCSGTCKTGFTGDACDACVVGKAGENCDLDCPDSCDTGKECGWIRGDAAASCVCSNGNVGDSCSLACPTGTDACVDPKICVATSATAAGCGCPPTLFGDDCDDKKCTETGAEACNNEGTCKEDFTCECTAGFEGDRCDDAKEEEPEEENGAGMMAASLMALTLSATGALLL